MLNHLMIYYTFKIKPHLRNSIIREFSRWTRLVVTYVPIDSGNAMPEYGRGLEEDDDRKGEKGRYSCRILFLTVALITGSIYMTIPGCLWLIETTDRIGDCTAMQITHSFYASHPLVVALCVQLASSNAAECQSICPLAYQPLCATNENGVMQTFQNDCSRIQENCQRNTSKWKMRKLARGC